MDQKDDDAKAQVMIPEAYFRKLKRFWDEAQRSGHPDAHSPLRNEAYFQREFRNIPKLKRRASDDASDDLPRATPSAAATSASPRAAHSSEEEMEGAGGGRGMQSGQSVMQKQRDLNLSLSVGGTDIEGARGGSGSGAAADGYVEQPAQPADLRDVASVNVGAVNAAAKMVPANKPSDPNVIIKPNEKIRYDSGHDWYYIG